MNNNIIEYKMVCHKNYLLKINNYSVSMYLRTDLFISRPEIIECLLQSWSNQQTSDQSCHLCVELHEVTVNLM